MKGCEHRAGHPDRGYPRPLRTASDREQPSSVCFPTTAPWEPGVCSSRVEACPRNAPSPAGFAPAGTAGVASLTCWGKFYFMVGRGGNPWIFILGWFWGHWDQLQQVTGSSALLSPSFCPAVLPELLLLGAMVALPMQETLACLIC